MLPITRATVDKFCRSCLQELPVTQNEREPNHNMQSDFKLHKWFQITTGLAQITKREETNMYPEFLCHVCYTKTRIFFEFRDKSICVSVALKEIISEKSVTDDNLLKLRLFCLTCLKKLRSLTLSDGAHNLLKDCKLHEWLSSCVGANIKDENQDFNPTHVCNQCYKKLRNFVEYRRLAQESQEYLDNVLGNSEDNKISCDKLEVQRNVKIALNDSTVPDDSLIKMERRDSTVMLPIEETGLCFDEEPKIDPLNENNNAPNALAYFSSEWIMKQEEDIENTHESENDHSLLTNVDGTDSDDDDDSHSESRTSTEKSTDRLSLKSVKKKVVSKRDTRKPCKIIQCEQCDKKFRKRFMYEAHVRGVHEGNANPFLCEACPKGFRCYSHMRRHFIETHDHEKFDPAVTNSINQKSTKWLCTSCNLAFESKGILSDHLSKAHSDIRPHKCDYCSKTFKRKDHLGDHIKAVHHGIRSFECRYCDKTFAARKTMRVHEMGHTGERPYNCEYCKKTFRQPSDLKIHMEKHTADPSLLCPICYRAKSNAEELQLHIAQHNSNGYQCTKCGKTFKKLSHLNEHDRAVHLLLRPFKCDRCDMTFAARKTLRNHELIHSDQKPVKCSTCQKGFRARTNLRKHMRTHKASESPSVTKTCSHFVPAPDVSPIKS